MGVARDIIRLDFEKNILSIVHNPFLAISILCECLLQIA